MQLEILLLSEVSQINRKTNIVSLVCGLWTMKQKQNYRHREQTSGGQGVGGWGMDGVGGWGLQM